MQVRWTAGALRNVRAIHDHIAQSTPVYAQRMVDRLFDRSEQLAEFRQSGRMVPEFECPELRELSEGPYRIIYLVTPETVEVLAVVHGRQLPPWSRPPE